MNNFDVPILLISFNRPGLTRKALENLKRIKPKTLFYSVDGPRVNNPDDKSKVIACKSLIHEVDWDCDLQTNFASTNYGCGPWMVESINWAFRFVNELIILEDDVLIANDFYSESSKLLKIYKDHQNIFSICASNISDFDAKENSNEIFFSQYFSSWGWATWKEQWENYSFNLSDVKKISFSRLLSLNNYNVFISLYFFINFRFISKGLLSTWDYQVNHLIFSQGKYVIKFKKNLSTNLGGGIDATHTRYLPKIQINQITGDCVYKLNPDLTTQEEKLWRKNRVLILFRSIFDRLNKSV